MIRVPDAAAEIDAAFLSEALGVPVSDFEIALLEGGVLADAFRLHAIRYAEGVSEAPRSVIVKIASHNQKRRSTAIENHAYQKELRFFSDLADDMPLRSPLVYHSATDGSVEAERFVLVMEDLGAHSRVFDQIEDAPDGRFMRRIAHEVAAMHARYWEAPETRLPWLSNPEHRYVFTFDAASRESPNRVDEFVALWRQMYQRELFDEGGARSSEAITRLLCGPACGVILDRISERLSQRPHTLLHGDLRADNIFRSDPARGLGVEDSVLTYIDWQLMGAGPPGVEFAQAWIHSLPEELRRRDREVLRSYHERLVALNPEAGAYSPDMLIEDYVLGICLWWSALVTLGANTLPDFQQPQSARMKRLWEISIPRTLVALDDHDCLKLLEETAAA